VFMLYPLLVALVVGLLTGGRPSALSRLRIRLWWLAIGGLIVQLVLFSPPVAETIGTLGPLLYIGSSTAVLVAVAVNLDLAGAPLIGLGGLSNLLAIVANGGWMPTSAEAVRAVGLSPAAGYSNSQAMSAPALAPLTDVMALPGWLPFANVFSVGDVVIGLGVFWLIVWAMHAQGADESTPTGRRRRYWQPIARTSQRP
jgi:Family of unknown function (DUF5317)